MSTPVRTKYYRTIDVANKYECQTPDVTNALNSQILKGYKRSGKWYILMDQPEAFEEFSRWLQTIPRKPKENSVKEPERLPETVQVKPSAKSADTFKAISRPIGIQYLEDKGISQVLVPEIVHAEKSIKIATSNFKNLVVKGGSIFRLLERKVKEGVKVQIICMKMAPGAEEKMQKYPALMENKKLFKIKVCPRNHMKLMAFDYNTVYIGSANLTNAAIGARKKVHMNYENGIITDDNHLVVMAIGHFDRVWVKAACEGCESKLCSKNQ